MANGTGGNQQGGNDLQTAVDTWPTPMAGTPAQNGNSAAGNSDFSRRAEELARNLWTTPQAHDVTMRGSGQVPTSKAGNACLARDAATWGTPRASDAEKGGPNMAFGAGGTPLPSQAEQWPTPSAAQDTKGAQADAQAVRDRMGKHQIGLSDKALILSHPAPETAPHGPLSLPQIRLARLLLRAGMSLPPRSVSRPYCPPNRRKPSNAVREEWRAKASWARWSSKRRKWWAAPRLSPAFVTWLMGWPTGHALCVCSEMEFTHWQQDMRGALSQLPTASGPWIWGPRDESKAPEQLALF